MNHSIYDKDRKNLSFKDPTKITIKSRQKHIAGTSGRNTTNMQARQSKTSLEGSSSTHYWNPAEMGDSRIRGVEPVRSTYYDTKYEDDFMN